MSEAIPEKLIEDAKKQLTICNACRYCEGYCAVWDAIEFKSVLNTDYIYHLANLCHDCRDCFYACPYNEPEHEFKLNIPKILGDVRSETYISYVKPKFMQFALQRPTLFTMISSAIAIVIVVLYASLLFGFSKFSTLSMTTIMPASLFERATVLLYFYLMVMWSWEGISYWSKISEKGHLTFVGLLRGLYDVVLHTNFRGGGTGCKVPEQNNRYFRLTSHTLVFFGFLVALIAISFYPNIYGYTGILYLIGSFALSTGTVGLFYIHLVDKRSSRSEKQSSMDYPFTFLLFIVGITGIIIPISTDKSWFNWNFLIHDALIMVVFLIAPFSKFMHPVFRFVSLIKYRSDSSNIRL